jgi:hypothetical protein
MAIAESVKLESFTESGSYLFSKYLLAKRGGSKAVRPGS